LLVDRDRRAEGLHVAHDFRERPLFRFVEPGALGRDVFAMIAITSRLVGASQ
jgi:hypothetical protein